jgi:threonine/homoserine/homoserine lactone efflux protein
MTVETWIAFVAAAMIVLIIPGPTIILVVSQAIAHGRKAVIPLVAGVALGDFTAMTLSLLGLGAILAASATLFSVLKWFGAAYLVYLGIKLWRSKATIADLYTTSARASHRSLLKSTFVVTALNPKSIGFFVAFLPQFVNPTSPTHPQLVLLGATFLTLGTLNATLYGIFAGHLRDTLRSPRVHRWFNRCGGSALIGAGIFTATAHQTS